ncbi:LytR/AlgR family response regulator transcription factor [Robinsoniella peoriensis]|uniref:LytR/AlgR family response regulator transcription factor n=1 Tax=Robinsoniella peoriensis TaxID=180332 RepID=UPI00375333E7
MCFRYKKGRTYHRILYSSILYFKSEGKKVYIILDDDSKEFYGKIDLIMSEVPLQKFIRIHKSYIINLNYIKEYCFESVKMDS